jgi:hypothetical protein
MEISVIIIGVRYRDVVRDTLPFAVSSLAIMALIWYQQYLHATILPHCLGSSALCADHEGAQDENDG